MGSNSAVGLLACNVLGMLGGVSSSWQRGWGKWDSRAWVRAGVDLKAGTLSWMSVSGGVVWMRQEYINANLVVCSAMN